MDAKQGAVYIARYVTCTCKGISTRHVGGYKQTGCETVAYQQDKDNSSYVFPVAHMHIDEGSHHPCHTYPGQNTPESQFGKLQSEQAVANPSQSHQNESSHDNLSDDGCMT